MISAAGAEGVPIRRSDALFKQETGGGTILGNRPGRGDVIGRHGIAEGGQNPGADDVAEGGRCLGQVLEKRRLLDVGRGPIPGEPASARHLEPLPLDVTFEHPGVALAKHLGGERRGQDVGNLLPARPDVGQVDRVAGPVGA